MPPCRRSQSGYRGIRRSPNGTFSAEIRSVDTRVPLGTFQSAYAVARAYDAAAWRLGRTPRTMNFQYCRSAQEAANLAPAPTMVAAEDRHTLRLRAALDLVEERDIIVVQAWYRAHPDEMCAELELWNTRAAERAERRAERYDDRQDRRAKKAMAEHEPARGRAWWPIGHEMWEALQDEVSCTKGSDADFESSESE